MAGFALRAGQSQVLGSSTSGLLTAFRSMRISHAPNPQGRRRCPAVVARAPEAGVGLMGTKVAMRTFFTEEGDAYGCTIIGLEPGNMVAQVKTKETDGYYSVQTCYKEAKEKRVKKPVRGHLKKHGCPPMKFLREWRVSGSGGLKGGNGLCGLDIVVAERRVGASARRPLKSSSGLGAPENGAQGSIVTVSNCAGLSDGFNGYFRDRCRLWLCIGPGFVKNNITKWLSAPQNGDWFVGWQN